MEQKIVTFVKKPKITRIIFFVGCMIISFGLGVLTHSEVIAKSSIPVIEIPKQPIPLALQYKNPVSQNKYDLIPALPGEVEVLTSPASTLEEGATQDNFVASKNGTKYYPKGCGGINRINIENRIYFATEQQAQEKGYTRTNTCN